MAIEIREAQCFLLPLERGQYAAGLVARAPRRGGVLLGYFFGPRRSTAPDVSWFNGLGPPQAVLACRFKGAPLFHGEWQLLGRLEGFDRLQWPVPAFHRFDGSISFRPGGSKVADWRVEYGDENLIVPLRESPAEGPDLKLADDIAYDAQLLAIEVGQRITMAVTSVDDLSWR